METLIEKQVQDYAIAANKISEPECGSDEHLDAINQVRKPLQFLTLILSQLNKNLRDLYNSNHNYITSKKDIGAFRIVSSINNRYYTAFRNCSHKDHIVEALAQYQDEISDFHELVHDYKHFRTESMGLKQLKDKLSSL